LGFPAVPSDLSDPLCHQLRSLVCGIRFLQKSLLSVPSAVVLRAMPAQLEVAVAVRPDNMARHWRHLLNGFLMYCVCVKNNCGDGMQSTELSNAAHQHGF
jgi:hypothetical protein